MQTSLPRWSHCCRYLAATCLLSLLASSVALAADETPPVEGDDEPLILAPFSVRSERDNGYVATNTISGTKIATAIKDLPFNVSVLTADLMKDVGGTSLLDVTRYLPGVFPLKQTFSQSIDYTIRGFKQSVTMRDGFIRRGPSDTIGMERIEVVKGPASLLYGTISPAGVVNYVSKTPSAKSELGVRQIVGDYNFLRTEIAAGGPLAASSLGAFRLDAAYTNTETHRIDEEYETVYLLPQVRINLGSRTVLDASLEHYSKSGVPNYTVPVGRTSPSAPFSFFASVPRDWNPNTSECVDNYNTDVVDVKITHALTPNITIRSVAHFERHDRQFMIYRRGAATGIAANPSFLELGRQLYYYEDDARNFGWQTDVVAKFSLGDIGSATGILGAEVYDQFARSRLWDLNGGTSPNGDPTNHIPPSWNLNDPTTWKRVLGLRQYAKNTSWSYVKNLGHASYLTGKLNLFKDRLIAIGGVRVDQITGGGYGDYVRLTSGINNEITQVSPQIGLMWRFSDHFSVYANHSESFVPNNYFGTNASGARFPYEPTLGSGREAGFKFDLLGGRVTGSVSGFEVEQTNQPLRLQTVDQFGNTVGYDTQGGLERAEGVEFEAVLAPWPNLTSILSYCYTDSTTVSNPAAPALNGTRKANSPRHLVSNWNRYAFAIDGPRYWWVAGGVVYTGSFLNGTGVVVNPSSAVVNLAGGYNTVLWGRSVEFALNVENVLDRYYITNEGIGAPLGFKVSAGVRF